MPHHDKNPGGPETGKKTLGKIKDDAQIPLWNFSPTNHDTTRQTQAGRSYVSALHHTPNSADLGV